MKTIIEEQNIVQNLSILLYSRTFETLYAEIYHTQTKNLLSKHHLNTSANEQIHLSRPIKEIQIRIKKNQDATQILDEFKFNQDFCKNSTIQQFQNYIKLKRIFSKYSLLFQIFYRLPSFNSTFQLTRNSFAQSTMIQEKLRKKQHLLQLKQMAVLNLNLLQHRVINQYQMLKTSQQLKERKKNQEKQVFKSRKAKKCATYFNEKKNEKRLLRSINNFAIQDNNTTNDFSTSKQLKSIKCLQNQFQLDTCTDFSRDSYLDKSKCSEKSMSILKLKRKKLTEVQGENNMLKKKIKFFESKISPFSSNENLDSKYTRNNSIIKEKTEQSATEKFQPIIQNKIQQQNQLNQSDPFPSCSNEDAFDHSKFLIQRQKQFKTQETYKCVQNLCFERKSERILSLKGKILKHRVNFTKKNKTIIIQNMQNKQKDNKTCEKNDLTDQKFSKANDGSIYKNKNKKINLIPHNQPWREQYYEDLFTKTMKSLQRQSKLINYLSNNCTTQFFKQAPKYRSPLKELSDMKNKVFPYQMTQQAKMFKLKKIKAQEQYLTSNRCSSKVGCRSSIRRKQTLLY